MKVLEKRNRNVPENLYHKTFEIKKTTKKSSCHKIFGKKTRKLQNTL